MEFLIDTKFWNKVIKKASPTLALEIKNALKKKKENYSTYLTPQKTWATSSFFIHESIFLTCS